MTSINKTETDWQAWIFTALTAALLLAAFTAGHQASKVLAGVAVSVSAYYVVRYLFNGDLLASIIPALYVAWGLHTILLAKPERAVMSFDEVKTAIADCRTSGKSFVPEYDANDPVRVFAISCTGANSERKNLSMDDS